MTPSAPTIRMRAAGLAIGGMLALAPSAHAQTRGTTMDDETKATAEVVEAFAQAQRGGDTDALLALFAPDAQWRVDPSARRTSPGWATTAARRRSARS